eukprot:CAMPEP_0119523570 /NCGR_PEP_ID=MMETSP1344-20130328/38604_1 /TAXON_ID=236787 /ORGANISM="Florenciella parvula, Strain CCMP2471" /LENGTH=61 /DNA_ID=CAMNT_0007561813 /DNA_START=47 /DNA_END=228 /DNA_ORIENTATION=+
MSKLEEQHRKDYAKAGAVRRQLEAILRAARDGEVLELDRCLDDYAAEVLREERSSHGLADG